MKQRTVMENEAGQRLDKLLLKLFSQAQKGFLYKMLRKKNIILNGKRAEGNEILRIGDVISFYFSDETYETLTGQGKPEQDRMNGSDSGKEQKPHKAKVNGNRLEVVYEDKHVLIINKPAGLLSQKSKPEDISLVEYVQEYLLGSGAITKEQLQTFRPGICNRLDRNTSGLVVAGKTLPGLQKMSELLRERSLHKFYLCIVKGEVREERKITGYLTKDEQTNQVTVFMQDSTAYQERKAMTVHGDYIETGYRPLAVTEDGTLLEVELITGKTHQIRAHLAGIGHPIAGDMKYGDSEYNREMRQKYGVHHQMLHAWRMVFPDMEEPFTALSCMEVKAECPREIKGFLIKNQIDLELLYQMCRLNI